MEEGDRGDCEDFALTKMQALIDAGYSAANLQLATGITETGQSHAFLLIQTVNRGTLVLDNRYPNIMGLDAVPYRVQTYQRAGQTWTSYTTRLDSVAIEYMSCNAGAFADGDRVVVEFTGQSWSSPKVIGFDENPVACTTDGILFWRCFTTDLYPYFYQFATGSYVKKTEHPVADAGGHAACGTYDSGQNVIYAGGSGGDLLDAAYQYTVLTETWADKTSMTYARMYFEGFSLAGSCIMIGGYDSDTNTILTSCEKWNYGSESWSSITSLPGPRMLMNEFVLGGVGHFFGGLSSTGGWGGHESSGYKYDEETNSWTAIASYPAQTSAGQAFEDFATSKGYCTGGYTTGQWDNGDLADDAGIYLTRRCYEFDPATNVWSQKADYDTWAWSTYYYVGDIDYPAGYYIDLEDKVDKDNLGLVTHVAWGGYDEGHVSYGYVDENAPGVNYFVFPPKKYQPSTDTWSIVKEITSNIPELFPLTCTAASCGCAI